MSEPKELRGQIPYTNTPHISNESTPDIEGQNHAPGNREENHVNEAARANITPNLNIGEATALLADKCQKGIFRTNRYWMRTEVLLLQLEKEHGDYFASDMSDTDIEITEQDENSEIVSGTESSIQAASKISRPSSFQSSLRLTWEESENLDVALEFEIFLQEVGRGSELAVEDDGYGSFIRRAIDGFRAIFQRLIQKVIEPCDVRMRMFLREVLTVRRYESELLSLAAAIRHEVSIIGEGLASHIGSSKDEYWKNRLKNCEPALKELYLKADRAHAGLELLQSRFSHRIARNIEDLAMIRDQRSRAMKGYRSFRDSHVSFLNCTVKELYEGTSVLEFKQRTAWHYRLDVKEFESLLARNHQALLMSHNTVQVMVQLIHGNFATLNKAFRVFDQTTIDTMFHSLRIEIYPVETLPASPRVVHNVRNTFTSSTAGGNNKRKRQPEMRIAKMKSG